MGIQVSKGTLHRGVQNCAATLAVFVSGAVLALLAYAFSSFLRFPTPLVLVLSLFLIVFCGYAGWSVIDLLDDPGIPAKRRRQLVFVLGLISPVLASFWVFSAMR